ncbi:unnamed protein product [Linum tenue]|uniref:Aquaporin n=1 Tax=Linum tenue TaxID=586396 RepID=A0AAV0GWA3_9ROSI|nr:unnamed protein product [Linum tenue]
MWRAAVTEMVATACLVFALTTTLISCFESGQTDPKLLVPVSIFISGFPLLLATIPLTGGHMNPVFTLAVALKGGVSIARAVAYFVAQCLGSLIAFAVVKATMDGATAEKYQLGGCAVNGGGSGVGAGTALALEFSCTFILLFVAMPILEERRRRELGLPTVCATMCAAVAVAYGLVVYVSITVTGRSGYSGVGLHPARCWAAAVLFKGPLWEAHWVFWLGPFLACLVYHAFSLALPREELEKGDEHEEEHSGRQVDKFGSDVLKDFEVSGF